MSAPNPGERDVDSVRRAQRAHEPSMEEILASIRAIIADDRETESLKAGPTTKTAINSAPQIIYSSKDLEPVREVEAASAKLETRPPSVDAPAPYSIEVLTRAEPSREPERERALRAPAQPQIEPAAPPISEPAREIASGPSETSDAPLVSEETDRAVTASFEELSASLALHSAELVESLTREMLRPMIKSWLDENLPSLVERLVRAEIQRVARGGR